MVGGKSEEQPSGGKRQCNAVHTREAFLKTGDVIFATLLLSWMVQSVLET